VTAVGEGAAPAPIEASGSVEAKMAMAMAHAEALRASATFMAHIQPTGSAWPFQTVGAI
jgi:hypothetical protein